MEITIMETFITNNQRRFIGLPPIDMEWKVVTLEDRRVKGNQVHLFFDGDIIRRAIYLQAIPEEYREVELCEECKKKGGRPLSFATAQKMKGINYFYFSYSDKKRSGNLAHIRIANIKTQRTYFNEDIIGTGDLKRDIQSWVKKWVDESTDDDLQEIERFRTAQRIHQKYNEGDFFAFRVGRRKWGFGRILMDVGKMRKDPQFIANGNYGLANLMGKALIVHIYHKITDSTTIDINDLIHMKTCPAQAIMDNRIYYGEYPIIGHLPITPVEYEPLISLGKYQGDMGETIVYLQYGRIFKTISLQEFQNNGLDDCNFQNESIGFNLNLNHLRECIEENSNSPYWQKTDIGGHDLRRPKFCEIRHRIFHLFGLDPTKKYAENLLSEQTKNSILFAPNH